MLGFHINQRPSLKFVEITKRVKIEAFQVKEPFQVGTENGIQKGAEGDWLLIQEGSLSVVSKNDFEREYVISEDVNKDGKVDEKDLSVVHKKYAKENKDRLILKNLPKKTTTVKKVVKRTLKSNPKATPVTKSKAKKAVKSLKNK